MLGVRHALVVHGDRGLDELALSGPSEVAEVRDGQVEQYVVTPEELGLQRAPLSELAGGDAAANAAILTRIFMGESGPPRDVVVLNAAAVLVTAGIASDLHEGVARAVKAIDSGAVQTLVAKLRTK